jgi:zinc protease
VKLFNAIVGRSACTALICSLFSLSVVAAGAGTGEALGAVESAHKQTPPPPLPPRPLKLPQPVTYKLSNGLTVLLMEDHRVPFVTVELGIKCGDAQDPKDIAGLASVTADMLTEGTDKYSSKQIASTVDSMGGALHGSADADFTLVTGSVLSKNQAQLLDMLADVVEHPSFPEDELKLEKANLLQELQMKRSNANFLAEERFSKVIFGDHPYAVVSATPQSVEKFDRDLLSQFHKTYYLPNASTLVVVGDFDTAKLKTVIEQKFGDWKSGSLPAATQASAPQRSGCTIYLVDRPGSVQSSLRLGNLALKKTDPDYYNAIVANQILGGSPMSRLFLNIREQKGYTYGAYSGFIMRVQPGSFNASAEVRTPVTGPSLKEFLYELNRIRTTSPTPQEMTAGKNFLVGTFQSGFETQANIAQRLLDCQLYDLPKDYLSTYSSKIMAVTPEDVQRIAQKYMDLKNLAIVVVGDCKTIEPELRTFAPVEVYDVNGKLLRTDSKS